MSILEFAPPRNPSFPSSHPHEWPADETGFIKPYVQVLPRTIRAVRTVTFQWTGLSREQLDYFLSFFHELKGGAGIFLWRTPDPSFNPVHRGPDLAQVAAGGAPGARSYSVLYTWYDNVSGQETKPSPASEISLSSGNVAVLTVPIFPIGVPAIRVYASETPGSEVLQAFATSRTWTEPVTGLLTGTSSPPTANTLKPLLKWRLIGPYRPERKGANRFDLSLDLMEQQV